MSFIKRFLYQRLSRWLAKHVGQPNPIESLERINEIGHSLVSIAPMELLKAGLKMHARGILNNHIIQQNPDWIWPYWIEEQFNPDSLSFIPRPFAFSQINVVNRNWTAIGFKDKGDILVLDPRGLAMPYTDSWSVDVWFFGEDGNDIIPSRCSTAEQLASFEGNGEISTRLKNLNSNTVLTNTWFCQILNGQKNYCLRSNVLSDVPGILAIVVRPYNMEGISRINSIDVNASKMGFVLNDSQHLEFGQSPQRLVGSTYRQGDVLYKIKQNKDISTFKSVDSKIGMASAAALFPVEKGTENIFTARIPLSKKQHSYQSHAKTLVKKLSNPIVIRNSQASVESNTESYEEKCLILGMPNPYSFLYNSSVHTLLLHTCEEVWAGPFTYKRFWFRDAAFAIHSLLYIGQIERARRVLENALSRQQQDGYFCSQNGEWDSNGQMLWIMAKYCAMSGTALPAEWIRSIERAIKWIARMMKSTSNGLLPPGFSAEHFGLNDTYYWDDFWSLAGLREIAPLLDTAGSTRAASASRIVAKRLESALSDSIEQAFLKVDFKGLPVSPNRNMDSSAVGNLVATYPLRLYGSDQDWLQASADYLYENCLHSGGLFHTVSHTGINPYLTLHLAQAFLRVGDSRAGELMNSIAKLASPTGKWPEAIHPILGTGCMGDGEHVWAAAEWIAMVRNCFVFEEAHENTLILAAGIQEEWLKNGNKLIFGPTPTRFGPVKIEIQIQSDQIHINCMGMWRGQAPKLSVINQNGELGKKPIMIDSQSI